MNSMKTIPSKRKKIVGGGVGMKGIVSALGLSLEGVLAAGTFGRWVGLYDGAGRGGMVGVFEVKDEDISGAGITQVLWSECGRYLCVVERQSDEIGVWDIRGTGKRLSWLRSRAAQTMQRLGAELSGSELWAGGKDGYVRVWEGIGTVEGLIKPAWSFKAHDGKLPAFQIPY